MGHGLKKCKVRLNKCKVLLKDAGSICQNSPSLTKIPPQLYMDRGRAGEFTDQNRLPDN